MESLLKSMRLALLEPYLYKLSTSNRIYLSKFRCRSNYMPVSKVYKHADTYDTKCKICDKNEIGDEFHYLFICPVFQEDRNRLLKEYYRKFPSMTHNHIYIVLHVDYICFTCVLCYRFNDVCWGVFTPYTPSPFLPHPTPPPPPHIMRFKKTSTICNNNYSKISVILIAL